MSESCGTAIGKVAQDGANVFHVVFGMVMSVRAVTSLALRRKSAGEMAYPKKNGVGGAELGIGKVARAHGCASAETFGIRLGCCRCVTRSRG